MMVGSSRRHVALDRRAGPGAASIPGAAVERSRPCPRRGRRRRSPAASSSSAARAGGVSSGRVGPGGPGDAQGRGPRQRPGRRRLPGQSPPAIRARDTARTRGGNDVYEAAVVAMVLANLDAERAGPRSTRWPSTSWAGRRPTGRGTIPTGPRATRRSRSTPCSGSGRPRTPGSTFRPRSGTGRPAGSCRPRGPAAAGATTATRRTQPNRSR